MRVPLPERFVSDIGIDLGTSNMIVYVRGRGVVLSEPSILALDRRDRSVVAVGQAAKAMLGRTPDHIEVIRPLKGGVIDRKSTRLNSSHVRISYAVFCLKTK